MAAFLDNRIVLQATIYVVSPLIFRRFQWRGQYREEKAIHRCLAHLTRKSLEAAKLGLGSVEHNGSASSAAAAATAAMTRAVDLFIVIMFCVLSENATEHTSRKHVKRTKNLYYKTIPGILSCV